METREGTILDTNADKLKDSITFNEVNYVNPANVVIKVGDGVIYIQVVTGNGKVINVIKEKKM